MGTHCVCIAGAQLLFYMLCAAVLCVHLHCTVRKKPQELYRWSNLKLMEFYCSFHDDDERDSFKMKLASYVNLFAVEFETTFAIREHFAHCASDSVKVSDFVVSEIIAFCCVMAHSAYEENAYQSIMGIISRTTRHEHLRKTSSKQSLFRNSMLGHGDAT